MGKAVLASLALAVLLAFPAGCAGDAAEEGAAPGGGTVPAAEEARYRVEVEAKGTPLAVPAGQASVDVIFVITNRGTEPDTYDLATTFFGMPWKGVGIPETLSLGAGESEELAIPLALDTAGTVEGGMDLVLTATSREDGTVSGEGTCVIETP